MRKIIVLLVVLFLTASIFYLWQLNRTPEIEMRNYKDVRGQVLSNLEAAIAQAVENGDYHCCIDPPCEMCYLGSWVFEDGKCDCDRMIVEEKWDKVCPECKKGIEEGTCSTSVETLEGCEINKKNHD